MDHEAVRRQTEDLIGGVHEWFYERLGGDPDELYDAIAGQLDFIIEAELEAVNVPDRRHDEPKRVATLKRLATEGRDPETIIRLARREGRDERLSADLIADIAVPEGSLPEDHPDYMTDRDPWSVAWDVADDLLHPERKKR